MPTAHRQIGFDSAPSDEPEILAIVALAYRAQCIQRGCGNLARVILRYFDTRGWPISNGAFCIRHSFERVERDQALGLRVYERERSLLR
jgi:hypothetical protein